MHGIKALGMCGMQELARHRAKRLYLPAATPPLSRRTTHAPTVSTSSGPIHNPLPTTPSAYHEHAITLLRQISVSPRLAKVPDANAVYIICIVFRQGIHNNAPHRGRGIEHHAHCFCGSMVVIHMSLGACVNVSNAKRSVASGDPIAIKIV